MLNHFAIYCLENCQVSRSCEPKIIVHAGTKVANIGTGTACHLATYQASQPSSDCSANIEARGKFRQASQLSGSSSAIKQLAHTGLPAISLPSGPKTAKAGATLAAHCCRQRSRRPVGGLPMVAAHTRALSGVCAPAIAVLTSKVFRFSAWKRFPEFKFAYLTSTQCTNTQTNK